MVDDIAGLLDRRDVAPLKCPLVWARDANKFDCVSFSTSFLSNVVLRKEKSYIFSYMNGTDLCTTSYYTNAIPIVSLSTLQGDIFFGMLSADDLSGRLRLRSRKRAIVWLHG